MLRRLLSVLLALLGLVGCLGTVGILARAQPCANGAAGCAPGDPTPPRNITPRCSDGILPSLIANGQRICGMSPEPYRVDVPGGQRTMVGFRSIADAFSADGLGVLVDYFVARGPGGTLRQYVSAANRHREVQLRIGSTAVRRWEIGADGVKREIEPLTLDAAPEIRNDRTMIPLRAAIEALGGRITGWDPVVTVSYSDLPTEADFTLAEAITPGATNAYKSGLINLSELYLLGDIQRYRQAELKKGNSMWGHAIPAAYVRFSVIAETVIRGHRLERRDYEEIASSIAALIGRKLTWDEIQEIGRAGERSIDIIAKKYKWSEAGYDPKTGKWVEFSQYNKYKQESSNSNGADRMYVVTDEQKVILVYIVPESKATLRPWVSPSRFKVNTPFVDQVERLSEWSNPAVSEPFTVMRRNLDRYYQLLEDKAMSLEEFHGMFNPVRVSTSPLGGASMAAQQQMAMEGTSYVAVTSEGELVGAVLPSVAMPPEEE